MVQSQEQTKCRQCGRMADFLVDIKTLKEWVGCRFCGYRCARTVVANGNGDNGDQDGLPVYKETERKGYGVMCITRGCARSICSFESPITEEEIAWFKETVTMSVDIDESNSYLSIWDDETGEVRAIVGELPDS